MQFSERQRQALLAVCNVFVPRQVEGSAYDRRGAKDVELADAILEQVGALGFRQRREFHQLLNLLASPALGLTWRGPLRPAHRLSTAQIERLLQAWSGSRLWLLRKGFRSLKMLVGLVYFGGSPSGDNPNWPDLQYEAPPIGPHQPQLSTLTLDSKQTTLDCDIVIVGSGAGGGVVARVLAAAGQHVLVVEKGRYPAFNHRELEMYNAMYEGRGLQTSVDGAVTVLSGSCLGGGTTVNWAGAFRTPPEVLEEWAKAHSNPQFIDPAYLEGFDWVERETQIQPEVSRHNPQNASLRRGAKNLGYETHAIPRNVSAPPEVDAELAWQADGFSPLGDSYNAKRSSLHLLKRAQTDGAEILTNATCQRVLIQNGQATGVEVFYQPPIGASRKLLIRANRVIICAGSIHTPAILRRSGLRHAHLGRHLYLHPTVPVPAYYDALAYPWYGPMMSAVCDEFRHLDGHYGFKLETPPAHPGLIGAVTPWEDGTQYKAEVLRAAYSQIFIVLVRDKFGGQIKLDRQGQPQIHYRLHPYDRQHLVRGMQEAAKIHHAAGAQEIAILHRAPLRYLDGQGDFADFIAAIPQHNWGRLHFGLYSAHQMGTCRMGGSNRLHPLQPNGETREAKGLYVADASAFPSASGANPMLSIQALAYYVARQILDNLKS